MAAQPGWGTLRRRMEAFWAQDIADAPCAAIPVRAPGHTYGRFGSLLDAPFEPFWEIAGNPRKMLELNLAKFEATVYCGDAFPAVFPDYGTAGHAAYFGGQPSLKSGSVWFEPVLHGGSLPVPVYDTCNPVLNAQVQLMELAAREADGRYLVAMPDNCGSLDALAHLRGNDMLLTDLIERPEAVEQSLDALVSGLEAANAALFRAARPGAFGGAVHSWMFLWAPGTLAQLQCDFSVMISPRMFERFALPELDKTSRSLDYDVYHLDGQEQLRHLDMILSLPHIHAIQWTPVAGQPKTSSFIEPLQKIQQAGKGLVLLPQPDELDVLMDGLSPEGVRLVLYDVCSQDDAGQLLKKVQGWKRQWPRKIFV